MRQSLALLSACAGLALAQSKTANLTFFFPEGAEGPSPVADILSLDQTSTVFSIACPTGTDSSDCGWSGVDNKFTIMSKSIYEGSMSADDTFAFSFSCNVNSASTEADCMTSASGSGVTTGLGQGTVTFTGTDFAYITATVTKGAELLQSTGSAAATTGGSSGSGATAKPTGSATASGSGSASGSAAPQHTGAAFRLGVEGSALLVMAGAAVVGAL